MEIKVPEYVRRSRKCITTFLICVTGIIIFVFWGIFPTHNYSNRLEQRIKTLQFQLGVQESLMPLYEMLKKELKQMESRVLPFPEPSGLAKEKTDDIFILLRDIAKGSNMEVISIVPNLESIAKYPGFLSVSTVFRGEYFDFRKLLIDLGGIPYLEYVGSIDIQQARKTKEFKVNIWIRLS